MIREELRSITCTTANLRGFSYVISAALIAVGLYRWWSTGNLEPGWLIGSGLFLAIGILAPGILKPLYLVWMGFAVIMGNIMTVIILGILYYLVVTPTGLLMRLRSKDALNRNREPQTASYWIDRRRNQWIPKQTETQY